MCEEKGLLVEVELINDLDPVLGYINDGVKMTAFVFEQLRCFRSIDCCRRVYMMKLEDEENTCVYIISWTDFDS
jgi:hypothetical protein